MHTLPLCIDSTACVPMLKAGLHPKSAERIASCSTNAGHATVPPTCKHTLSTAEEGHDVSSAPRIKQGAAFHCPDALPLAADAIRKRRVRPRRPLCAR